MLHKIFQHALLGACLCTFVTNPSYAQTEAPPSSSEPEVVEDSQMSPRDTRRVNRLERSIDRLSDRLDRDLDRVDDLEFDLLDLEDDLEDVETERDARRVERRINRLERKIDRLIRRSERIELRIERKFEELIELTGEGADTDNTDDGTDAGTGAFGVFHLVDAAGDSIIREITDGEKIPKSELPSMNLSVIVDADDSIESVKFNSDLGNRIENFSPYSLFGDDTKGEYWGQVLDVNVVYTIEASAYGKDSARGEAIATSSISFEIVDTDIVNEDDPAGIPSDPSPTEPLEEIPACELRDDVVTALKTNIAFVGEIIAGAEREAIDNNGCTFTDVGPLPVTVDIDLGAEYPMKNFLVIAGGEVDGLEADADYEYSIFLSDGSGEFVPMSESIGTIDGESAFVGSQVRFEITACSGDGCPDGSLLLNELIITSSKAPEIAPPPAELPTDQSPMPPETPGEGGDPVVPVPVDEEPSEEQPPVVTPPTTGDPAIPTTMGQINTQTDLIALHYDHAPDRDDGHSAAADRSVLGTLFGCQWIESNTIRVSGAYGKNAGSFNSDSDAVMDAAFNECGGWVAGHNNRDAAVEASVVRWIETLEAGGDVFVKEGGQSDLTAAVVRRIKSELPTVDTKERIHVVQHSDWNENETTDSDLDYVKQETDYQRISDANSYLNVSNGDKAFEEAARSHPEFGNAWNAAFDYYSPDKIIDFSDTGELFHILGEGTPSLDEVRQRYLEGGASPLPTVPSTPQDNSPAIPTNGTFIGVDGTLVIDATSARPVGSWKQSTIQGASVLLYDGDDQYGGFAPQQALVYPFTVNEGGTYNIALYGARDDSVMDEVRGDLGNDVYVSVKSANTTALEPTKLFTGFGERHKTLEWGDTFDKNHNKSKATVSLQAGVAYELIIGGRSDGYALQKITLKTGSALKDPSATESRRS